MVSTGNFLGHIGSIEKGQMFSLQIGEHSKQRESNLNAFFPVIAINDDGN